MERSIAKGKVLFWILEFGQQKSELQIQGERRRATRSGLAPAGIDERAHSRADQTGGDCTDESQSGHGQHVRHRGMEMGLPHFQVLGSPLGADKRNGQEQGKLNAPTIDAKTHDSRDDEKDCGYPVDRQVLPVSYE